MSILPTSLGIDPNAQKPQVPVQEQAPVQPPPGALETFNSFLQRYVESNPALGLSNFQMTPEALSMLGSKPENKLLAGIGSAAKGFSEGWAGTRPKGIDPKTEAEINKLNAETKKIQGESTTQKPNEADKFMVARLNEVALPETMTYFDRAKQNYIQASDMIRQSKSSDTAALDSTILTAYLKTQNPLMRIGTDGGADPSQFQGEAKVLAERLNKMLSGKAKFESQDERDKFMKGALVNMRSQKNYVDMSKKVAKKSTGEEPNLTYSEYFEIPETLEINQGDSENIKKMKALYNSGKVKNKEAAYDDLFLLGAI